MSTQTNWQNHVIKMDLIENQWNHAKNTTDTVWGDTAR